MKFYLKDIRKCSFKKIKGAPSFKPFDNAMFGNILAIPRRAPPFTYYIITIDVLKKA